MPKDPIDYSKTIIYKIVSGDSVYVGSTCNFRSRKCDHKKNCNSEKYKDHNLKVYQIIRANGGWENAEMTPIELFPCNSSIEARIREEHWRKELQAEMNSLRAYRSEEDLKQDYEKVRDEKLEYLKKYNEEHKEKITKQRKQYREERREEIAEKHKQTFTCECGSICRINDKNRHFKSKKHQTFMHK
jgi:hypothetical protein